MNVCPRGIRTAFAVLSLDSSHGASSLARHPDFVCPSPSPTGNVWPSCGKSEESNLTPYAFVEALPADDRALVVKRGLAGQEHGEVAAALGIETSTAAKRWSRDLGHRSGSRSSLLAMTGRRSSILDPGSPEILLIPSIRRVTDRSTCRPYLWRIPPAGRSWPTHPIDLWNGGCGSQFAGSRSALSCIQRWAVGRT